MIKYTRSQKPLNIVIIGLPGCGKGTQSAKIAEKYNVKHVSSGEILREEKKKNTPQAQKIKKLIFEGTLLPDELVNAVVLANMPENNFILDGYPRKISQEAIERILHRKEGRKDDNEKTIKIRLDAFHEETKTVIEYYKSKGIYHEVNASGSPDAVFERIVNIIENMN